MKMFKCMAPHCIVSARLMHFSAIGYDLKVCLFLKVKAVGEEMGIGFLGLGFQPKWALSDIPIMPKVIQPCKLIFFNFVFVPGLLTTAR